MGLKHSYTLLAPFYDAIVDTPTRSLRQSSLKPLFKLDSKNILIDGIGTGLDIPYLPLQHKYTATDLTPAMLDKCARRLETTQLDMHLLNADVMNLPFEDNQFDIIVMHLILAVVAEPEQALSEASRVLKPGGTILILDKFIQPGKMAIIRRTINIFMRHLATRTDVVFEKLLESTPQLQLMNNQPALLSGWFRFIELSKTIK